MVALQGTDKPEENNFVACMGHAVYNGEDLTKAKDGEKWIGGVIREGPIYWEHVRQAAIIAIAHGYECLILSGGHTRTRNESSHPVDGHSYEGTPKSEACGMLDVGIQEGWFETAQTSGKEHRLVRDPRDGKFDSSKIGKPIPILLEEYARDSFENLLFSILRYRQWTGKMPDGTIGVVSFPWKGLRYSFAAGALGVDPFHFYGAGQIPIADLKGSAKGESGFVAMASADADHRGKYFSEKRRNRTRHPSNTDTDAPKCDDPECDLKAYQEYWKKMSAEYGSTSDISGEDVAVRKYLDYLQSQEFEPGVSAVPFPWP